MAKLRFYLTKLMPDWPIVIWMIAITLLVGLFSGNTAKGIISTFNSGWGYAVGEFALILLPSFVIAATFDRQSLAMPSAVSVGMAPVAGAGMICPDTAFAALSPMAPRSKLSLAFSAYAGFKLLFPAGPLIVATSLGVADGNMLVICFLVFVPVWLVGLIYCNVIEWKLEGGATAISGKKIAQPSFSISLLEPFFLLFGLMGIGAAFDLSFNSWFDFATDPKGALILTAFFTMSKVNSDERRACLDGAIRRTGVLLLIIGAASAFSAFITSVIDVESIFSQTSGVYTLLSLFSLAAFFKLLQGSSMSTFAAAGPVALPIVAASEISPVFAVLAVCLGSFVAILPNDSFYWLVRKDALKDHGDLTSTLVLASGSLLQATVGLALLLGLYASFSF